MKELFMIIPKNLFRGLFVGLFLGLVIWVISSPILGHIFNYRTGALIAQLLGSFIIACISMKQSKQKYNIIYILLASVVIFCTLWYGEITIYTKNMIDTWTHEVTDVHYVMSYSASFGALTALICGCVEAVGEINNT